MRVRYLPDSRLAWEQVRGPEAGSQGEQNYSFVTVRSGLFFLWWQEKDQSVVSQVVDIADGRVHTTWISAEKTPMAPPGTIQPAE